MKPDFINSIPGLKEAVAKQDLIRDAIFLPGGQIESIAGFTVLPMTPFHLVTLHVMQSPMIEGGTPSPEQLAAFLWVLNPRFGSWWAKRSFLRRCRKVFKRAQSVADVIDSARLYLQETFQDRPASNSARSMPSYYSPAASLCFRFGSEPFYWPEERTLHTPLKKMFQYLRLMNQSANPGAILFNPSDAVIMRYTASLNAQKPAKQ